MPSLESMNKPPSLDMTCDLNGLCLGELTALPRSKPRLRVQLIPASTSALVWRVWGPLTMGSTHFYGSLLLLLPLPVTLRLIFLILPVTSSRFSPWRGVKPWVNQNGGEFVP